jgi:NADPH2:quinone reductase
VVAEVTGGRGVDVVLDMVGAPYLERNLASLATEGRLVQIAVQGGFKAELNLVTVMQKRLTVTGSTLRPRPVADKARIAEALRAQVWPRLDRGEIRPVVHARFPLSEAAEAHRLMESSAHVGKIVLTAPAGL